MSMPYFRYVPNFEYVNRLRDNKTLSEFIIVKNLFKRQRLANNIISNLSYFTKYQIIGDERPDNVAYKIYENQYYDWLILLCNNIINVQNEWPMSQQSFESYLYKKYTTDANLNSIHHYESKEIRNSSGDIVVPAGLNVPSNYSITYYDNGRGTEEIVTNIAQGITNLQYETQKEEDKRNIFLIKPKYIGIIMEEVDGNLLYQRGSSQYVSDYLVKGENIRLYS